MKELSLATVVAGVAAALIATATITAEAQTAAEATCRAAIAKESNKYLKTALKISTKCHLFRSKGKAPLSTDCNDLAVADTGGKLVKARAKMDDKIAGACGPAASLIAQYGRCPSPANEVDDAGATTGIDDFAELSTCVVAVTDRFVGQAMQEVMGLPASSLSKDLGKCQKELGKNASKLLVTIGKERARCQADRDANNLGLAYGCNASDPKGKIGKTHAKLDAGIAKRCNVDEDPGLTLKQELDKLDACADTVADLQECVGDIVAEGLGSGLIAMAYELPDTCNAGGIIRIIRAAGGDQITNTFLSTGWTGTAHLVDLIDFSRDTVTLDCDADCANCDIALDPVADQPDAICRCGLDPTQSCEVINGVDVGNCGLLDTCNCNFGAPLALSSGGVPVCVLNRYTADHVGTADVGRGILDDQFIDTALVHLGENTQLEPCPTCVGDPTPNDGTRGGSCTRGLRINQPCDVNAIHPTFGPASHDCPPNSLTNISGGGLRLNLAFKTAPSSLPFTLPCDNPPGELCPCRVCSGNTLQGCSSDQECADAGAGTCTAGGGAGVSPNACNGGLCVDGFCPDGPTEMFCDGKVRGNGRGFLQCNTTADCVTLDAGACTIEQVRACYNDPIEIDGSGNSFGGDDSTIFCIPPTNSAAVNNSAGLPGAGAVTLNVDHVVTCASDPSVVWQPPAGINCP